MTSEQLNGWLTLGANVGVIAGLILVAVQINQNTQITQAQIANDYYLADMQLELAMMGENPAESLAKAVYTPDELTELDRVVLDRYFNYGLVQLGRLRKMDELGLAPEGWEDRIAYLEWHLGNEVGRRWWATSRQTYSDDFRRKVDAIMARSIRDANRFLLDGLGSEPADATAD